AWGTSNHDVWLVGENGVSLHDTGRGFAPVDLGTKKSVAAVAGSSASDVWMAAEDGSMFHGDAVSVRKVTTLGGVGPQALSVAASNGVWVAGFDATVGLHALIVRFDGATWSSFPPPPLAGAFEGTRVKVVAASKDDVYFLRDNTVYHWDGKAWTQTPTGALL